MAGYSACRPRAAVPLHAQVREHVLPSTCHEGRRDKAADRGTHRFARRCRRSNSPCSSPSATSPPNGGRLEPEGDVHDDGIEVHHPLLRELISVRAVREVDEIGATKPHRVARD